MCIYVHNVLGQVGTEISLPGRADRRQKVSALATSFSSTRRFRTPTDRGRVSIGQKFFVVFEGPVFDLWRKAGSLQPQWPIQHLPQIKRWLPRLEAVVARGPSATPTGMLRRVCRLQQFLSDIAKEPAPEAVTHAWLAKAQQRLLDTPNAEAAQVARELGLSYETFRKEFARETGLPPARYQLRRRIDQARRLITERHLTNKEIAEALGFYDEFHFSRRFREATGQSTRAFRQGVR